MPDQVQANAENGLATSTIGPELQSLPLQLLISGAMNGIVSAQAISAKTTADFLKETNENLNFSTTMKVGDEVKNVTISVPELAVVPIPSLRVDSATIHFNFEIKEFSTVTKSTNISANMNVGTTGWLKNLVSASISGNVTHSNSSQSTVNRSGLLDITIHLSEPALPEGLSKVLNLMSNAIIVTPSPAAPANPAQPAAPNVAAPTDAHGE